MQEQMDIDLTTFLLQHHLCVIATVMPDGMPHAAVMHYSVIAEPLRLLFCMSDRSVSATNASDNNRMSVVVGWSGNPCVTAQMRGKAHIVQESLELAVTKAEYYALYPHSKQYEDDPHTAFIAFVPIWSRFSNLNIDPALIDPELWEMFKRGDNKPRRDSA